MFKNNHFIVRQLKRFKSQGSFFLRSFAIIFLISSLLILAMFAFVLNTCLSRIKQDISMNIENLSYALAQNYMVYDALVNRESSEDLNIYFDKILDNAQDLDVIAITLRDRQCLYHPNPDLIGKFMPSTILQPHTGIISFAGDSNEYINQLCATTPIVNSRNITIGYVVVGIYDKTFLQLEKDFIFKFLWIGLLALLTNIFASYTITRFVKKTLFGYEPTYFAELFIQRSDVVDNMEEGILAINTTGEIIMCNKPAYELLQLNQLPVYGQSISDVSFDSKLLPILNSEKPLTNVDVNIGDHHLIIDWIAITYQNESMGFIAIIRNKTILTKMAEELTGVNFILEALRSNLHEFKNNLHIILGLLQLGETEMAIRYISEFNSAQVSINTVINNIEDKTIAALIFGKINEARENAVALTLDENSYLSPPPNFFLSTNQFTTIIGNLLENSIDATKSKPSGGQIQLFIKGDDNSLKINIDDNGCGIPDRIMDKIFSRGFSTKGENRGIGLALIKQIIDNCNGTITIDSSVGEGTSISILFTQAQ